MCFPSFQYKMVKTKWKKSLDLEKFHPKKLKTSNFLEVLHAFLWYSFSSWDLCVCIHLLQTVMSAKNISSWYSNYIPAISGSISTVTVIQQYRPGSSLGLSYIQYLFIRGILARIINLTDAALMAWKSGSLLSDLIIKVQEPKGKSGQLTR